jgi:ABC-2 type transport system permease protein
VGKLKQKIENLNKYRFLMMELVKKDIKLKYRRSYIGYIWTLLEPLLTMVVLTLVFSNFYGRKDQLFPVYVLTGRLLYTFFSNSTKAAMKSIRQNGKMIKKVYVPKYIYPLSSVLSNFIIFLLSLIVLVGVSAVLGMRPTPMLFFIVVPLFLLLVMTVGAGLILSTLAVFFRDLEYLWGVILMLIMYSSAIFYDIKMLDAPARMLVRMNPLYLIIENFRNAVYGDPIDQYALLVSAAVSFLSLLIGVLLFYKKQDKFILNI